MSKKQRSVIFILAFLALLVSIVFFLRRAAKNEEERFDAYTQELFRQEVSGNSISLHYTLKNPKAYGILSVPDSFGTYPADPDAACASYENALASLHRFSRKKLTKEQKLTYDVLEDTYKRGLTLAPYLLYDNPLASLTGIQSQLPLLLCEYRFYTISDVDSYFALLKQTPGYFASILSFLDARSASGLFLSEAEIHAVVQECSTFLRTGKSNVLYSSFSERLDALCAETDETIDQKSYIKKNRSLLKKYVFPAFQSLIDGIQAQKAIAYSASDKQGACSLPNGKRYYELLVASETGSGRSIETLQGMARSQIFLDLADMQAAMDKISAPASPTSDFYAAQGTVLEDTNPLSILHTLRQSAKKDFPGLPEDVDIQVKYVQSSMQDYLSPAFYMIPAIDNSEENVIYINPKHLSDDMSLFTTLAHEGYPGHLYQNVYYRKKDVPLIRHLLDYGGYTEGWATYCEMLSYYYAPVPRQSATLVQKNTSLILGLYALADMGIHYDGWNLDETVSFFADYGITDKAAVEDVYQIILSDPANYLKYYIGYLEILELKKEALVEWGEDFTQKKFHKVILDTGPAPFGILEKQMFP